MGETQFSWMSKQNRKFNKKRIHIHGNYMHESGLQVQARFCSALTAEVNGQLHFTQCPTHFSLNLNNLTDQVVLVNHLLLLVVLLVCKTLEGPKRKKTSFLFIVLEQTEANEDAHCLYFMNCALG